MRKLLIIGTIIFMVVDGFNVTRVQAQDADESNAQIWIDFFYQYTINNNFRFLFHTNYKHLLNDDKWDQYMIRPTLIYTMNDYIYFQGGMQFLYTDQGELNKLEIRPWQGMNIFFPRIGSIYINHFLRLEERFFFQNMGDKQASSLRGRYAIMTRVPLNRPTLSPGTWYLWPNFEFFGDLAGENIERFIASTRYSMGIGYEINEKISCESVYMLEMSRDRAEDNFHVANHIVRLIMRYQLSRHSTTRNVGL